MSSFFFLTSLLGVSLALQLLRFPYLVLENGGGAFLILFFLGVYSISFPLLVIERVIDNKLRSESLASLLLIKKNKNYQYVDSILLFLWFALRMAVIFVFLWLFLYLGARAFLYVWFFVSVGLDQSVAVLDNPTLPQQHLSLMGGVLWSAIVFGLFLFLRKKLFALFMNWVLPFCFVTLVFLLAKTLVAANDLPGLKIFLYPDFSSLTLNSISALVGHSMVCVVIGLGFYDHNIFSDKRQDPIELLVRSCFLSIFLAALVGGVAAPVINQASEHPYGINLIFEILPRWLSYSQFGTYDCFLFFLSLSLLSLYLSIVFMGLLSRNMDLFSSVVHRPRLRHGINFMFVVLNGAVIYYLQTSSLSWIGQSAILQIDGVVANLLMPLLGLLMIWFAFKHTTSRERSEVFAKQQVFFHNRFFYSMWEKGTFFLVPTIIIVSILIYLLPL